MRHPFLRLCLVSLLGLLSMGQAGSGPPADPSSVNRGPGGFFIDTVDVNLINVDVRVTDKRGRPIAGLTAADFEVFEDGNPVEITNFYAIAGRKVESGGVDPIAAAEPGRIGSLEPLRVPEDQKLHLVIYVDNVNIHPLNRRKGFSALRSFVRRRVGPDDRVMVVSYDRSLNERQAFTADKERVIATLDRLEDVSGHRVHYNRTRSEILNDIYDAEEVVAVSGRTRMYAESVYNDLNYSIDALRTVVDSLAGLPGRKAVLYLSDGIEMRAGEDMFYALEDKFEDRLGILQAQNFDVSRRFRALTEEASTSRVTFYTLDAAGLRTHSNADVGNYQAERGTLVESTHVANLQAPLQYMAAETGGQAILNTNNFLPMLERVGDDFDTYYSLGYASPAGGSGRFREIEVKLKGPGGKPRKDVRLRHRQGYRDKSVEIRMSEKTLAALNYGYAKNTLGVEIEFGRGTRKDDDAFLIPLVVKIPMGNLAFVPRDDLHRASVRLYITARNENGGISPVEELSVPIEIPREEFDRARAQAYHLQHTLMMAPGGQLVAVGVRDEIGAVTAFVLGGLRVGA